MLSGDVLSQWLQRQTGTVVQGSRISLSRGGLLRISDGADSIPVRPQLPVVHGGQAAVARAQDATSGDATAGLALRVQAVTSQEEQSRQMERLVSMLTVATAAREQPQAYPAVLPVHESFILTVPGTQIPMTGAAEEYELWCDVMAWCPDDLNGWQRTAGPQHRSLQAVLPMFVPVIATVQAVHENLGIIHRDITPNNVMVDPAGRLLLADWGIAHGLAAGQTSTYTQLVGNRGFALPPEMLAGDPSVGRYTDAWYLGCLLSWMLTGDTPGPQHGPPWLPPGLSTSLPVGGPGDVVRAVVGGLCAPDPRQRLALPDALAALREGRAPSGPVAPVTASPTVPVQRPAGPAQPYVPGSPAWGSWQPSQNSATMPGYVADARVGASAPSSAPSSAASSPGRWVLVATAAVVVVCLMVGGAVWAVRGLLGNDDAQVPAASPKTTQPARGPVVTDVAAPSTDDDYVVWGGGTGPFVWPEGTFPPDYVFTSEDQLPRQITCHADTPFAVVDLDALVLTADVDVAVDVGADCDLDIAIPPETNWTLDWNGVKSYDGWPRGFIDWDFTGGPKHLSDGQETYRHVPNPGQPVLHFTVTTMSSVRFGTTYDDWNNGTAPFTMREYGQLTRFRFPSADELPRQITCNKTPMTGLDFRRVSLGSDVDVTIDYALGCPTNTLLLSPDQNWTIDWTGTGSATLEIAPGVADASGQTVKAGTKTVSHVVDPGRPTLNLKVTSASVVHVEPQVAVY
ncbi:MAG: hypothetical protein FWH11_05135 [Micrococcales bacterium]|nr:hypothetical protein [Micrococcales bacterium]